MAIKYPEFYRNITKMKIKSTGIAELKYRKDLLLNNKRTTWRFLEIFLLSNGHYFGFESTTNHSWYLTRNIVDIISSILILTSSIYSSSLVRKDRFKELGSFALMIFEKLRQDFLDIYPSEFFIRNSYIKNLQMNQSNENQFSTIANKHENHFLQKINRIPEQRILSTKF
jgi:hypothetical protein